MRSPFTRLGLVALMALVALGAMIAGAELVRPSGQTTDVSVAAAPTAAPAVAAQTTLEPTSVPTTAPVPFPEEATPMPTPTLAALPVPTATVVAAAVATPPTVDETPASSLSDAAETSGEGADPALEATDGSQTSDDSVDEAAASFAAATSVEAEVPPTSQPTSVPAATLVPTAEPTASPEPTATSLPTPEPTASPEPTATAAPTATPSPTSAAAEAAPTNQTEPDADRVVDQRRTYSVESGWFYVDSTSGLLVRSEPGGDVLRALEHRDAVFVTGQASEFGLREWVQLESPTRGWVASEFLTATEPAAVVTPVVPSSGEAPTEQDWAALRACESSGNYSIVSSNGLYHGAYQFLPSTWDSIAGRSGRPDLIGVLPSLAAPADQDAMALALYELQGASPWPVCGQALR